MKYKLLTLFCAFLLIWSCSSSPQSATEEIAWLAEDFAEDLIYSVDPDDIGKMAVIPFVESISNENDAFSNYFADELITAFIQESWGSLDIYERTQVNQLMEEAQFAATGMISEDTAVELGKMIGVDALVIGTFTKVGDRVRINSRLVVIETGQISAAVNGDLSAEAYHSLVPLQ